MFNAIARWLVTFGALSGLLTWCFLNRGLVAFDFSPLHDPVHLPLFMVILLVAMMAFLWGAGITWLSAASFRAEHRALKRELRETLRRLHDQDSEALTRHPEAVVEGLLPPPRKSWWKFSK